MHEGGDPFNKVRKHDDLHIDFTPMIDSMFLLLMFNIMIFAITGTQQIQVPDAVNSKGTDTQDAVLFSIKEPSSPGGEATVFEGEVLEEKRVTLDQIKAIVERAVAQGRKKVYIKAEKKVPYKAIMEVAGALGSAVEDGTLLLAVQQSAKH